MPNLFGFFKHGVLAACDGVCGEEGGRRSKGDAWWWDKELKETISGKNMHTV